MAKCDACGEGDPSHPVFLGEYLHLCERCFRNILTYLESIREVHAPTH